MKLSPIQAAIQRISVFLFCLLAFPAQAEVSKERVFILAGQSNMMGKAQTSKLPDALKLHPENVAYYTHGRKQTLAKYQHFGPEVQFAHAMSKTFPNDKIIIIKSVASGSQLSQWMPGEGLYEGLLRQVSFVVDPKTANIEAFAWMQGETDARSEEAAQQYGENLQVFISSLRQSLHNEKLPILIGQITQHGHNFPMEPQVREAQSQLCEADPYSFLIKTDSLGKIYDKVHFSADGLVELGRLFAIAFINQRKAQLLDSADSKNAAK